MKFKRAREKIKRALSKAGENEEKANESKSTEQNKYRQYRSSICKQLHQTSYFSPF